jgi:hypothetical protein
MGAYYITANINNEYVRIELDATTNITETLNSKLNMFTFEDASEGADNFVKLNNEVTLSGTITDIKTLSSGFTKDLDEETGKFQLKAYVKFEDGSTKYPTVDKNRELLETIRDKAIPVGVHVNNVVYQNCYLTGLTFNQNNRKGTFGRLKAFAVNLRLTQIRTGARSDITVSRDPDAIKKYQERLRKNATKKKPTPVKKKNANAQVRKAFRGGGRSRGLL